MRNSIFKIVLAVLTVLLLQSCEKEPVAQPNELITQSFGVTTKVDQHQIHTKSWNPNTWIYNYSTQPATLTLTGTGSSTGRNYSIPNVTIQQLRAGTVTQRMYAGTYTATYQTPHIRTTDAYSRNGLTSTLEYQPTIGDVLDIKVSENITVTGTPVILNATLEDALVIVDIPALTGGVNVSKDQFQATTCLLMYDEANDFHWGYFAMDETERGVTGWGYYGLEFRFTAEGITKTVDGRSYNKGYAYHIQSPFTGGVELIIPDMSVQIITVE